jgi:hypothetical protein
VGVFQGLGVFQPVVFQGAPGTYTHMPSGGLQSGGRRIDAVPRAVAAGGFQSAGAAATRVVHRFTAVAAGGLQSGGASVAARRRASVASGGLAGQRRRGAPAERAGRGRAGGLQASGTGASARRRTSATAGGLQSAGAALSRIVHAFAAVGSGGLQSAGVG